MISDMDELENLYDPQNFIETGFKLYAPTYEQNSD